jgi:hypothetical protein
MQMASSYAMKSITILAFTALSIGAVQAEDVVIRPFKVMENKAFAPVELTLDTLIARKAKVNTNHVCVIGETLGDESQQAWVHWREGKAIILWEPTRYGVQDLTLSKRYLRLDKDVVAENDKKLAAGSSYLVTTQWAKSLIAECAAKGNEFSINKKQAIKHVKQGKAEQ